MKPISLFALLFSLSADVSAQAQGATAATDRICMDVAHQPRFWRDPSDMPGMDVKMIERVKYMTGELVKTATAVGASLSYLKKEVQPKDLEGCDLLFIHIPSTKYTPGEVSAISSYVTGGGSLFLVMDQDMWSTLEQTNVNDVIRPFGVQFGGESPDSAAGGHTNAGLITDKRLKISYHGARTVTGGTAVLLQRPLRCPSLRHLQGGREGREGRRHGRRHGVAVHDQLGRRSGLPVPGVHAGGVSVVAEVIDAVDIGVSRRGRPRRSARTGSSGRSPSETPSRS